jgi:hypothetical protein
MDMTPTLAAKSNQLNSDDLIVGPKTITVTKVTAGSAEQPVAVYYEGDQGKPWYPCKSMRRVLVAAWGADASAYIGRSMTLFRDPEVSYGGIKVGGIRISALSNLDSPLSIALTVTRQKRAPYKVQPLKVQAPPPVADAPEVVNPIDLAEAACIKAGLTFGGIKALCHKANEATSLSELPFEVLDYIINNGIAADKVAMFNAQWQPEPEAEDDDELPAAWAA